jgi:hypothetical protein
VSLLARSAHLERHDAPNREFSLGCKFPTISFCTINKANSRRITNLESRLDDILELLSQRKTGASSESSVIPGPSHLQSLDSTTSEWEQGQFDVGDLHWNDFPFPGLDSVTDVAAEVDTINEFQTSAGVGSGCVCTLGITGIEVSTFVLQYLLDVFRKMVQYFPFIQLPQNATVATMITKRPFLVLAAVTAAASKFPHLQEVFARELKETLSSQVLIDGEKSLDLLQGLLVHLAWYAPILTATTGGQSLDIITN